MNRCVRLIVRMCLLAPVSFARAQFNAHILPAKALNSNAGGDAGDVT